MAPKYVGQSLPRRDGAEKVTGAAIFTHDVTLPGMLHAKILHSPHPHAIIKAIHTEKAAALPGVRGIVTWENTPRKLYNSCSYAVHVDYPSEAIEDQYVLDNRVRYVGDEVAAVAAVSEKVAARALKLIEVEYELLPAVFDPREAIKDSAADIHENKYGKNLIMPPVQKEEGNFEKGFRECDVTFETTVKVPIQKQVPMETSAAVAYSNPAGKLVVYSSTQAPHPVKLLIAQIFGIPECRVQVLNPPYAGGGFGQKAGLCGKAELLATALSLQTQKPVKLVYSRKEDMSTTDCRHNGYIAIRLGAKKDGSLHALEINPIISTGAYTSWGGTMAELVYRWASSTYHIPHHRTYGLTAYTNTMPAGAFRGFGNPQAMFAMEEAVDNIAGQLGRDPVDLRLQNTTRSGEACWPTVCSTSELNGCISRAAEEIGWSEKRGRPQSGTIRRGVGLACGRHISSSSTMGAAFVGIERDGHVFMNVGLSEMGTGIVISLPQVLADAFEIPIETAHINLGDTDASPFDIGGHSCRSLYEVGLAAIDAATALKKEIELYAARQWGLSPDEVHYADARVSGGGHGWTLAEAAYDAHRHHIRFSAVGKAHATTVPPWQAQAAEVEVDMETGLVTPIKIVSAHDLGKAVNPLIVEGQIEGGVMMGVGYGLREEMIYLENGELYNDSIHTYMMPTADDIPEIVPIIIENEKDPCGPFGAKGFAECSVVPTAAALASAVEDAIGIRMQELPMTPGRVLQAIHNGADGSK